MARRRTPEDVAERKAARAEVDDPEVVLTAGLRFLEARSRSVAEVRRRLTQAGYRPALIEGAITRLMDVGMLDDAAFARQWVESRDRAHPRGERALTIELRQKGIETETIAATLQERRDGESGRERDRPPDLIAAQRLIARNARMLERIADPRQRRQRAYALLARNGFDPETCREASADVARTEDSGDPD